MTSRPEWQFAAISSAVFRASGSSDRSTRSQIPSPRTQNRACEQNPGASLSRIPSPSIQSARSRYGTRLAVSVPSNPIFAWVPSQKGGVPVRPHRQRAYVSPTGYDSPSRHAIDSPSASQTICCRMSGTPPVTIYGPFLTIRIVGPLCSSESSGMVRLAVVLDEPAHIRVRTVGGRRRVGKAGRRSALGGRSERLVDEQV